MRNGSAKPVAFSGLLAALAMAIMCLGGLIPLSTYICPMICSLICFLVLRFCGKRLAWSWYFVVSFLCMLVGPDKEAAVAFQVLSYYPIVKQCLDAKKFRWLWKALLFNTAVGIIYLFQVYIMGIDVSVAEFQGVGLFWLLLLLVLGNATFFLVDKLLNKLLKMH